MARQIKLLIVDDEERFLKTLTERLSMRDFDVTPVTSGDAALRAAKEARFDIALVDLKMPGMSGEEVLEELKKRHPLMEVVILTGYGSVESAVRCTRAGSYHYLQKPCDTDQLLQVLVAAYQQRVQRRLALDEKKMQEITDLGLLESPLGILRRLRDFEDSHEK